MTAAAVLGEAWGVYRLLFRRSVATAFAVFLIVNLVSAAADVSHNDGAATFFAILATVLSFAGPLLVQGALVRIVGSIHEARRPETIEQVLAAARRRFWPLLGAALVYGIGVAIGLLLLIVPGLIAAARWCLMAPLIMLEGMGVEQSRLRSRELVAGSTFTVLLTVVTSFLLTALPSFLFVELVDVRPIGDYVFGIAWSSLSAPFTAHVLTVVYYRLKEPERPVVHPDVRSWRSVWDGA